jgi:hypothetical protein
MLLEEFYPEYLELFEQELFKLRQLAGKVGGQITVESGRMAEMRSKIDPEKQRAASVKNGLRNVENGFFTVGHPNCILTFESQSAAGTIGGTVAYTKGVGIFDSEKREERRRLGIGEFSQEVREARIKNALSVAEYLMENKLGVFSEEAREKTRERSKKTVEKLNTTKWLCMVTGKISTKGPLTRYQKKLGIDPALKVRISDLLPQQLPIILAGI